MSTGVNGVFLCRMETVGSNRKTQLAMLRVGPTFHHSHLIQPEAYLGLCKDWALLLLTLLTVFVRNVKSGFQYTLCMKGSVCISTETETLD